MVESDVLDAFPLTFWIGLCFFLVQLSILVWLVVALSDIPPVPVV